MIVLMAGLPGTGKSTTAKALAPQLRATILDKDRIRPALFTTEGVTYTRDQDDFCFQVMLDTATFILTRDARHTVILDGRSCTRAYQVQQVRDLANQIPHPLTIIECICDDATARRRLDADVDTGRHPATNRTFALHQKLKAAAEPIPDPKLVLDTAASVAECVNQCLSYIDQLTAASRGSRPWRSTRSPAR
jgi:predicted kinase